MLRYIGVFAGIALSVLLVAAGPVVYNRYFSIVGRARTRMHFIKDCGAAESFLKDLGERHRSRKDFQFHADHPARVNMFGQPVTGVAYLHLYDVTLFDDVQLGVLCDTEGQVTEVHFIGD